MKVRLGSLLSLGAIAAIFVLGTAYLTFQVARVDWFEKYTTVSMEMADAANLVTRSPVLLSGIRVGQVTAVSNAPNGVRIDLRIDRDYRIPVDSTVTVEHLSALGEPYLEFQPTRIGGPYLVDGQRVRADAIRMPVSIPEMASTVTSLLQQFDPKAIKSLIQTFSTTLNGTDALVPELARGSDLLAATLLSRSPQLSAILANAQVPGPDVAKAGADMAAAGPKWAEFGVKVTDVVGSIETLLNARPVPEAYTTGTGLLPFLGELIDYIGRIGPDAQQLFPLFAPLAARAASSFGGIDLSALITQALHGVGPDGSLRLQINLK
ncbi:MlaD family protein [Nocardia altamirensis]|uniref:MlaD family protein n=1 Tax=Nocardia altamirensis TaxID=472158 RepID=UPI0008409596|nr:MlaD family protein [Nocardia altamirensis]